VKKIKLIFVSVIILEAIVNAETIVVPDNYGTLMSALSATAAGDTVVGRAGVYEEIIFLPGWPVTLAGEYLLSGDTADIAECIITQPVGSYEFRCVYQMDETAPGRSYLLGWTLRAAVPSIPGGVAATYREFEVRDCVIDRGFSGDGGGFLADNADVFFDRCRFTGCGTNMYGAVGYLPHSTVTLQECVIESCYVDIAFSNLDHFRLDSSTFIMRGCAVRNTGWIGSAQGPHFFRGASEDDRIDISNCAFLHCRVNKFLTAQNEIYGNFRFDSCLVDSCTIVSNWFLPHLGDSTETIEVVGNTFSNNTRQDGPYLQHGLFDFGSHIHPTRVERNLILNNNGGHTSFCTVSGGNPQQRSIAHNYVINCRNLSISFPPSGQVLAREVGDSVFYHNIFMNNIGYAVFQGPGADAPTHAERNYWNHESGPYDSVNNPFGQGDTVDYRIIYEPWETDTIFDTTEVAFAPIVQDYFIGAAFPNPFNSSITIEYVILHDSEITLDIFDLLGRHVESLFNGNQRAGVHHIKWNAECASGIYFARLSAPDAPPSLFKLALLR
jgi:hypothetical protein